ncbi:hypothetical protein BDR26DRAFT_1007763 [Obelidium mucronatum]|nr:hypothetical protein BDR26DRAFT_1007763 [Obelidium mucronatum]
MSPSHPRPLLHLCFDSSDSDSDDDTVNCICKRLESHNDDPMVQCSECKDWLHCGCVGLQLDKVPRFWCCPICSEQLKREAALDSPCLTGTEIEIAMGEAACDVMPTAGFEPLPLSAANHSANASSIEYLFQPRDDRPFKPSFEAPSISQLSSSKHQEHVAQPLSRSATPEFGISLSSSQSVLSNCSLSSMHLHAPSETGSSTSRDGDSTMSAEELITLPSCMHLDTDFMLIFGDQL